VYNNTLIINQVHFIITDITYIYSEDNSTIDISQKQLPSADLGMYFII